MINNFDSILKENIEALFGIFGKREGISFEHTDCYFKNFNTLEGTFFKSLEFFKIYKTVARFIRFMELATIKNLNHIPISVDFSNDPLYIEGIEKGEQKGALKKAEESVVRMLQRGYTMEQITGVLNVSVAFVLELQKKRNRKKR
jgi:hypothetical protein